MNPPLNRSVEQPSPYHPCPLYRRPLLILAGLLFLLSCRPTEQEASLQEQREQQLAQQALHSTEPFNTSFDPVLESYFKLTDALVASDSIASLDAASRLLEQLTSVDGASLDRDSRAFWVHHAESIRGYAETLSTTEGLEKQRIPFQPLSEHLIEVVRSLQPVEGILFIQSCPMVRGGSAPWLSREEPIRNPYHGERMMNCGETLQRI